ncbi:MAG: hypothetical protein DWI27_08030 [Planctomycetota bacterium]|jgi:hypothetical protein|nr:MAG: hypothetical protein DWI27_08030 [Planctomycetota bacterium]
MPRRQTVSAIGVASLFLALAATSAAVEPSARPEKVARVFVLAGQSNMEGQAVVDLAGRDYNDGKGTLTALMRHPDNAARLAWLRDADGTWRTRDDVFVRYAREDEPLLAGPLGIGYAVYGGTHHFGAELAFGKIVGGFFAARGEPVLLVKTAWGGKSLFADFRPPSAGATTDAEGRAVPAPGPYYTRMVAEVKKALAAVPEIVPGATRGELAGFVWWHGWNDGVDPERAVPAYGDNLAALLRDVRRDLDSPELPVVIGELTGPWIDAPEEWEALRRSQRLVAERGEFRDHARFVGTRTFVRAPEDSPNPGHGHHEFGNAETYLLVGEALGRGMVSLLSGDPVAPTPPYAHGPIPDDAAVPGQPAGRSEIGFEGFRILVDDRLLPGGPEETLGREALEFLRAKLVDIRIVMLPDRLARLREVPIVVDLSCGDLGPMQYHPSADWLAEHGYPRSLVRCVHLPRAADVATKRNVAEQPWVILHELAHAYHDRVLGFDDPRVLAAWKAFKAGGKGDKALLYDGSRVRHYGLTDQKEFFAEMTEAFFGANDFAPFNRAELKAGFPELHALLEEIWGGGR